MNINDFFLTRSSTVEAELSFSSAVGILAANFVLQPSSPTSKLSLVAAVYALIACPPCEREKVSC